MANYEGKMPPGGSWIKGLMEGHFRCREHERLQGDCPACRFLIRLEDNLHGLRTRRARLFEQLKTQIRDGQVIIVDLR